jgi:hypothetical protein
MQDVQRLVAAEWRDTISQSYKNISIDLQATMSDKYMNMAILKAWLSFLK